ncbi:carbohydrate binding domain-containing protein [Alkalihalophilus pseudofirmus]|uniref:carbohydrate binding domain-containing protein n=1 Tax=Alkalihalophilus pseudofirmus TaxID=79885 RepID=UPI00259B88B6|nr:carbohydrate binding domain-containing protein [Alkalihalophilus pseudofirmus]WEG15202.1 carbohydrate binding domain-containing protein [Alkalihalophilus pseudofirmus]
MKKSFRLLAGTVMAASLISMNINAQAAGEQNDTNESSDEWKVVWEDHFEGTDLDLDKWSYDTGNGFVDSNGTYVSGWGNEELQSYQQENVRVEDGKLVLTGQEESVSDEHGTYNYTSGKIHTQGKFSQKYGKFEAKMALPEGQGYWPAFWMMPEDDVYGGWAASGEIDIMENAGGRPNEIGGAIHYGGQWPNNTYTAKDYHFPEGQDVTNFNVYAVEWEPGEIRWYVNGELYQTLNNWSSQDAGSPAPFAYPAPFDQEFYLILNLAIGGWYGGNPDATTDFPGEMQVDYVKVYELEGRDYREPVEPVFEAEELPENAKEAIDGNYVYDSSFEQEITTIATGAELDQKWSKDYWNLVYLSDFNGDATVSKEELDGYRFAKVDIARGGSQSYSVQMIQNVTLGKGRWYKLSFDAKSTTARPLNVKLGGGPDRGYTAYSPNRDYTLSNQVETYELVFQMQHDTDILSRLEFNMGLNTNPVWLGNVTLEEVDAEDPYQEDAPKNPLRNGNHVYNGNFDLGRMDRMTFWNFETNGAEAEASVEPDQRELHVQISDGGESTDAITFTQKGMNLLANNEYQLSFEARADEAREIGAALLSKDGTISYFEGTETITTEMNEHVMTFTMPDTTDIEGQLVFYFGGSAHDVMLDSIKLERLTDIFDGLTFDESFPLKNGAFVNGLNYWDTHIQGDHEAGTSIAEVKHQDGMVSASIENEGYEPWHVLLMQNQMQLLANQTYILEFDASSTVKRELEVVLENSAYERYVDEVISLTPDMQTYSFEFNMTETDLVDLKYLMGKVGDAAAIGPHEVKIDQVKLEVKGEREKFFPLANGDFSSGLDNWNGHVQGSYDGPSQASFEERDREAVISVTNEGENPWDISLSQQEMELKSGETYVLQFDARASLDRKNELVVDNGAPNYHRYFEDIVQLDQTRQTFSYEFEMPESDSVTLSFLVGKVAGETIGNAHDIVIDNVILEVKGAQDALHGAAAAEEPGTEEPGNEEPVTDKPGKGKDKKEKGKEKGKNMKEKAKEKGKGKGINKEKNN